MQHVVIVSLAAALALPLFTDTMAPFSRRDLPIFLAFAVIVMTLVVQGLTLKPLIRALKIGGGRRARWMHTRRGLPPHHPLACGSVRPPECWRRYCDHRERARRHYQGIVVPHHQDERHGLLAVRRLLDILGCVRAARGAGNRRKVVLSLDMTTVQFMILAQTIIFLLGWLLEWTEIIVIFMPIFIPLLKHFSIDPLFFGLLVALNLQTAFLSPPHVTLNQIFAGMMPFMAIQVLAVVLLYLSRRLVYGYRQ